jgi:hypothetical protein
VLAQTWPICVGRTGGSTDQNLRSGLDPLSGRISPTHIISWWVVLGAPVFGACLCWPKKWQDVVYACLYWVSSWWISPASLFRPSVHVRRHATHVGGKATSATFSSLSPLNVQLMHTRKVAEITAHCPQQLTCVNFMQAPFIIGVRDGQEQQHLASEQ